MYGGSLMLALGLAAVTHDESRLLWAAVLWLVLEQKVRAVCNQGESAGEHRHTGVEVREQNMIA
jgi:hypothetical protein